MTRAEEALSKANDELELRVEEHTAELRGANMDLRLSRRRIVNSQEAFRRQVAEQLHGPIQTKLLIVAHRLEQARRELGPDPSKSIELVSEALNMIEEVNGNELPKITRQLHPSIFRMDLLAALQSLAGMFQRGFEVSLRVYPNTPDAARLWHMDLSEEIRLAIYRVAEETLNNVFKHAAATRVDITLGRSAEGYVTLAIRDDGRGFDTEATPRGLGIHSM